MHRTNFICYVCVINGVSSLSSKRRCSRRTSFPSSLKEVFKQRPGSGDTQFFLIVLLSIDDPDRVPASGSAPVHRDLDLTDQIQSLKELKMKEKQVSQRPLRVLISRSLFSCRASC